MAQVHFSCGLEIDVVEEIRSISKNVDKMVQRFANCMDTIVNFTYSSWYF